MTTLSQQVDHDRLARILDAVTGELAPLDPADRVELLRGLANQLAELEELMEEEWQDEDMDAWHRWRDQFRTPYGCDDGEPTP